MGASGGVALSAREEVEPKECELACVNLFLYWLRYVDLRTDIFCPPGPTRAPMGPKEPGPGSRLTVLTLLTVAMVWGRGGGEGEGLISTAKWMHYAHRTLNKQNKRLKSHK